jgi:hypothetical protein
MTMTTEVLDTRCRCCAQPTRLLPRVDLGPGLAVCPRSGQLHRADGAGYTIDESGGGMARRVESQPAARPVVYVDLSKEGYA